MPRERVRIKSKDHAMDPPVGTVLEVERREHDAVVVRWLGRMWPMLPEHTEDIQEEDKTND